MLSAMATASSDDYFAGSPACGMAPEAEEEPPVSSLADDVIAALRAAGIHGTLRDPRRHIPGQKGDVRSAGILQVRLQDTSIATMIRAQAALAGFAFREGHQGNCLYVARCPRNLAETIALDLSAHDLVPGHDFKLYDARKPAGEAPDFETADLIRVTFTAFDPHPMGRRNLMMSAEMALRSHIVQTTPDTLTLLVL